MINAKEEKRLKILRDQQKYFKEKINTTLSEKMIIFFKSFFEFMTMSLIQSTRKQHNQTLHNQNYDNPNHALLHT